MLTENELEEYLEKQRVTDQGKGYIRLTRKSEPSRLVGTQAKTNVCTWFVSKKMGHTIQAESRTAELGFVLEFEYSDDVFEYWDQPPAISVIRTYSNGTRRRGSYIADFLVLDINGPRVVEVKTSREIEKKLESNPSDWKKTEQGIIYQPAKDAFSELGLNYHLYSTAELNPVRTANLNLLLQARSRADQLSSSIQKQLSDALKQNAWMTLADLAVTTGIKDYTPIFQAIVAGSLFVDLEHDLLSQPESVRVSASQALLDLSRQQEAETGHIDTLPDSNSVNLVAVPTEKQAQRALEILERIKNGENCRCCVKCGETLSTNVGMEKQARSWELKGAELVELVDEIAKDHELVYPDNSVQRLITHLFDNAWDKGEEQKLWKFIPRDECLSIVSGHQAVTLTNARRLAYRLGVRLVDLLRGDIESTPYLLDPGWSSKLPEDIRPKKRIHRHQREKIYEKVLDVLNNQPDDGALPLREVARRVGTSVGYLHYHFPVLCKRILDNHRRWKSERKQKIRQQARQAALQFFTQSIDAGRPQSRKGALRILRKETGLPKHVLREEINTVHDTFWPSLSKPLMAEE